MKKKISTHTWKHFLYWHISQTYINWAGTPIQFWTSFSKYQCVGFNAAAAAAAAGVLKIWQKSSLAFPAQVQFCCLYMCPTQTSLLRSSSASSASGHLLFLIYQQISLYVFSEGIFLLLLFNALIYNSTKFYEFTVMTMLVELNFCNVIVIKFLFQFGFFSIFAFFVQSPTLAVPTTRFLLRSENSK